MIYPVLLLLGLANGAVFASLALALVVTFRSSGVINFATAAMALFAAYLYAFFRQGQLFDPIPGLPTTVHLSNGMGFAPAAGLALVVTALFGLALYGVVFRPLRSAPPVARAMAAIGVGLVITGLIQQRVGDNPVNVAGIFPSTVYVIDSVHVTADRIWFAVTIIGITAVLASAYRFTRFGLRTRAAAETEKGAFVSGISPDRTAAVNWMIGAVVAGAAGILISPIVPLSPSSYSLFIVPALAAAILGRFQGMAIAVAGGLVIGMLQSESAYFQSRYSWWPTSGVPELIPLVLILAVLIWRSPNLPARGEIIRTTLGRAPRPRGLLVPTLASVAAAVVTLALLHGQWREALATSLIFSIIMLSQVVVTGFAGQVSLAQLVLAGTAGFALSTITVTWGIPFPIAPILAALVATVIGVVVGLPAVRIRGLPLAVVTLALAVAVEAFWFQNTNFVSSSGKPIGNPSLFGLNLGVGGGAAFPRLAFCFMVLIVLVVVALGVAKLRTSRLGSAMLAVRANERSAAASGINVVRTKLVAFAIAAFLAGIGGSLLAYQQTNVTFDYFDVILGLGVFATAYLAGVTSVSGGILAGMLALNGIVYQGWNQALGLNYSGWYTAIGGVGLVLTVIRNPEGIVGQVHGQLARLRLRRTRRAVPEPPPVVPVVTGPTPLTPTPTPAATSPAATTPAGTLLSVDGIFVRYGGVVAVDHVSIEVPRGGIVGLIGPNGAGKTTLIDAISGFVRASGTVTLAGRSLDGMRPHERARAGLGRTFQAMELWDDLTVAENVGVSSRTRGRSARGASTTAMSTDEILALLGLQAVQERPVSELSQGQRQLVSIARSLLGDPELLILDEPAAGLDSTESVWLGQRLRDLCVRGFTILLIDHDMGLVLSVCDEIHVLNFGELVASGSPETIRADPVVTEAYLGTTHARGPVVTEAPLEQSSGVE